MAAKKKAKGKKPAKKSPAKAKASASRKAAPAKKVPAKKAPAKKAAGVVAKAAPAHNPWHSYADQLAQEMRTTLKVMRAFPADQAGFQPHPRSGSAMQLFHTFGVEQNAALMAVNGNLDLAKAFSMTVPATLADAIDSFERAATSVVTAARSAGPDAWHRPQPFFTGPQQMGQVPAGAIASMMLADQIHHRGQLSVYLRMAGGKVPSIYGPSADEPW
ncbi:MAG TPA: DinB family protein [Gemmatimonadaceae bacterium]|nr:DinB family protein [Gemmatimonadaceae bacterium]